MEQAFVGWCIKHEYDPHSNAQRDQQIVAWENKIAHRQNRRAKALILVLKHKADEFRHREDRIANVFNRLTDSSFPRELLLNVIEATVQRQWVSHWIATQPGSLENMTRTLFLWPNNIPQSTRDFFQQQAVQALLKISIIAIPVGFTVQATFLTPPLLAGHEQHLRNLVLDLKTSPGDGKYNREMNKSIKSMPSLLSLFPRLKSCVFLLHFRNTRNHPQMGFHPRFFNDFVLDYKNLQPTSSSSKWEFVDFKDTILDFIANFTRSGPGQRKFIRFSNNCEFRSDAKDSRSEIHVGPLVDVSYQVEASTAMASGEGATDTEDASVAHAVRIFELAYRSPRVSRYVYDA